MDVDEDEDATQRPKAVADYGIEVDFESIDEDEREEDSAEAVARYDKEVSNINSEIERMAPNMKAMERCVSIIDDLVHSFECFADNGSFPNVCYLLGSTMSRLSWLKQRKRLKRPGKIPKKRGIGTTMLSGDGEDQCWNCFTSSLGTHCRSF